MSTKHLIVVGLPKSGTTYLYDQTGQRPDRFAMPRATKEVDYFRRGRDLQTYLSLFDGAGDGSAQAMLADGRVRVDCSPLYLDDLDIALPNMAHALQGLDLRIVVCLRDPLERAYSHYLHDVAQNQKIYGHADYSFWSPPVLAKYLFAVAPRVQRLRDLFGAARVYGFAFGSDPAPLEQMLRDFAGLEAEWSLNMGQNPAPGFTAPHSYYNADSDSELALSGQIYRLPAGHLLVANRQFSLYRRDMHRPLAEQIMMRQAAITRHVDTAMIGADMRARIYDDMGQAAQMLGLDLALDARPRVMQAKTSDRLPDPIRAQLTPLCDVDHAVAQMMQPRTRASTRSTVDMPHAGVSIARDMARLALAFHGDPAEPEDMPSLQQQIIDRHGPIPHFIEKQMHYEVAHQRYDAALELFAAYGGAGRLLWPVDLARFLQARQITLPTEVEARFAAAGIRTQLCCNQVELSRGLQSRSVPPGAA